MTRTRRARGRRTALPPPVPRTVRQRPRPYDRDSVLARWSGCAYCPGPAEELDHVHPLALTGRDRESNVVAVCSPCNHAKGDMPLAAWAALPAVTTNTEPN